MQAFSTYRVRASPGRLVAIFNATLMSLYLAHIEWLHRFAEILGEIFEGTVLQMPGGTGPSVLLRGKPICGLASDLGRNRVASLELSVPDIGTGAL